MFNSVYIPLLLSSLYPLKKKEMECIQKHTGHIFQFGNTVVLYGSALGKRKEEDLWLSGDCLTHDPQQRKENHCVALIGSGVTAGSGSVYRKHVRVMSAGQCVMITARPVLTKATVSQSVKVHFH